MAEPRHDPTFMDANRLGAWCSCSCGWRSITYVGVSGAVLAHGQHLVKVEGGDDRG